MLRVVQNSAPQGAKSYYSTADYYTEGQELTGVWRGKGAERLGLTGAVGKEAWDALCDNRDPATGETLTSRRKENRRVGYDFNFHCPKSVSLLYGLTDDARLLDAFRESVRETMDDLETEMQTRVRSKGRDEDRTTSNMVYGEFVHLTARPVDGVPDPHLHAHCFVFNTTWDDNEGRWKAGQFAGLKRDAPFFEALFHARLGHRLEALGIPVERTRTGWEIEGLSPSTLKKFSRRTERIEEKARAEGINDPAAKGDLGAKTRERKAENLSMPELRALWRERLSGDEEDAIRRVGVERGDFRRDSNDRNLADAVSRAVDHCFERRSVVPERVLQAAALKMSVGIATPGAVLRTVAERGLLRAGRDGVTCVTTSEVLAEEERMIAFAREGRGTCAPLAAGAHAFTRDWLNGGQRRAVEHVLHSPDRVTIVRGAAGTGKTSMMAEACEAIERTGTHVGVFAPSADASRGVLRGEGFAEADTVARLLKDERMQAGLEGQVIWVDEAGLLSSRTTAELFALAGRIDARLVLSGDRKQHGSVERGAALRLLEEEAGLKPVEIKEIQRQKGDYKNVVAALSEGRVTEAFRQLDRLGWVREVGDEARYGMLADDYAATVASGKSALIVSPTHAEAARTTNAVRERLMAQGTIGHEERAFSVLKNLNLTQAERADVANLRAGDVLVFHQNAKGHASGDRVVVGEVPPPVSEAAKYQVFHATSLALAPGDVVRVTRNGKTADGRHRLNNGALYGVAGFDARGDIVLANGWTVGKEFGHLAHGYCVTSHASQGKTVDRVFVSESSQSFPAASREQFYVSVSRGRESAVIYTDDKAALKAAVGVSDDRTSATELVRDRVARQARLPERDEPRRDGARAREIERVHG
jgi:conjugative relaxase-like TrwC/TraI family protein